MDDFMERLDASVLAGHQGGDELNAFKKGFKKDGEEVGVFEGDPIIHTLHPSC